MQKYKDKTNLELLEELQSYEYECVAGKLENAKVFMELKERFEKDEAM